MDLKKMIYKNGEFEVTVEDAERIKFLAEPCKEILNDCKVNYIALTMVDKNKNEFVFTMQRKEKK